MVQGSGLKKTIGRPGSIKKSARTGRVNKHAKEAQRAKLGNPLQLPRGKFRDDAIDDRALSKAIDKASEAKVAAKFIQGGGKVAAPDLLLKGKEINKEKRRSQLKKKVGRTEQKLNILKAKSDRDGVKFSDGWDKDKDKDKTKK
ncbi:hypothetical protein B484DRAFT_450578 [Ochromonadaceae sp. CCMP2298]|nr:hypothetical protein B484DRAFT_450578 [Ochromonadaceae sp. CCMP2298]|eukprot:CAMPEP_0173188346 /NCGR_PEP_ID=MMETSP1141-20130122/11206_1 /TAXON_ID=483371 /ORGANISM="non described non described, Strain CCMP2298" /LENGTH=143 /DNA_ID=CAMNT_0014112269 /DNA_START=36 /DNA_END=467 /DNA_ORIENTATION=-